MSAEGKTTIRQLGPPEWLILQQLWIDQFSESLPDPETTRIFAMEEEDGKIVGFIQIESLAVHIRHIYLDPEHRGDGKAEELVDHVRELFRRAGKRAHLVASSPFAERLAGYAGMKKLRGTLWEGNGDG